MPSSGSARKREGAGNSAVPSRSKENNCNTGKEDEDYDTEEKADHTVISPIMDPYSADLSAKHADLMCDLIRAPCCYVTPTYDLGEGLRFIEQVPFSPRLETSGS